MKGIRTGKAEAKLLLQMMWPCNVENPKDVLKELLELIHKFSKVTGYKVNMEKQRETILP